MASTNCEVSKGSGGSKKSYSVIADARETNGWLSYRYPILRLHTRRSARPVPSRDGPALQGAPQSGAHAPFAVSLVCDDLAVTLHGPSQELPLGVQHWPSPP